MKKTAIVFSCIYFFTLQSFCQSLSDTVAIRNVDVVANKKSEIENFTKHFDSLTIAQFRTSDLSTLLNESGGVFVKSFGAGSVATASAQGTSAYHTQVYWNGIAINNPMLGLSDLSLIPVNFSDEIFISNATNEKGNTSIGSAIHLNTNPRFENAVAANILFGVGSFENYKTQMNASVSTKKQNLSVKYFHEEGNNNFPFINTSLKGKPEVNQTNNKVKQDGFAADYFLQPKTNHLLSAHVWIQKTYRENPPTMTTDKSVAYQEDNVNRFLVDYTIKNKITDYKLQVAWLNESINYVDSFINLESFGRAKTLVGDFTSTTNISKIFSVDAGITNSHYFVFADEYKMHREQNRFGVFTKIVFTDKKKTIFLSAVANEEFLNDKTNPVNFSFESKIKLIHNLFFTTNIANTSRLPTLNDEYWIPGGNPNLKPEKSFCKDAGLNYNYSKNKITFSISANAFTKYITNWIQWLPGASGYWEPQNVYNVWARGGEGSLKFEVSGLKLKYFVGGNFSYTRSTRNEEANEELNKKQLIYVPEISSNANAGIFYKGTGLIYSANYKGTRYTSSDNKEFLEPCLLQKISAEQKISLSKKLYGHLRFSINNLFNVVYQTIPYRPMPGRNYELTLQLNFKQKINKNKNEK